MTGSTLLTDDQLASWLTDGYLVLQPEQLDDADHQFFYQRAADLYALSRATGSPTTHLDHLGDNLRAQVPEIDKLLSDPAVEGALQSLLGADYLIHPHSYCHRSSERDQIFHQDGNLPWNERGHYRSHRSDWAMLFYYPQDVDEYNGPTEVVPGSQYWTVDHEIDDDTWHRGDRIDRSVDESIMAGEDLAARDREQQRGLDQGLGVPGLERRFLPLRAGSVVIAHYDLIHRGSRTTELREDRFLYKFYFARVHTPLGATSQTAARPLAVARLRPGLEPVVAATWAWTRGHLLEAPESDATIDVARQHEALTAGNEEEKVAAAYLLGRAAPKSPQALATLDEGLNATSESTRRAASHGLRQAGQPGLEALRRGTRCERASVRRGAVAGLGTEMAAESPAVTDALLVALATDNDDLVRSNAAYSVGQIARSPAVDGNRLAAALIERLEPGAEPDNAANVGLTRSTVRQSAAYGLVQVLANHSIGEDLLDRLIDGPLRDDDRYVQGLIAEALARADPMTPSARQRVVGYLASRRWNPTPDPVGRPSA